jgi:RsiW-degrading membrane proteinase PrsW (M82 family)
MGVSIPDSNSSGPESFTGSASGSSERDLDLDLDAELPPLPVAAKRKSKSRATDGIDENLEFVEDSDESGLPSLPVRRKKKKRVEEPEETPRRPKKLKAGWGDVLVWAFLVALIPLAVSIFLPNTPLEQRILKSIANDPAKDEDLRKYGPVEFMLMHDDFTLADAHIARQSELHWLHALAATLGFWFLLHCMRSSTNVGPWTLLLTGLFTGTVGIAMLLVFQVIAEISLPIRFIGTGISALILVVIKFIGFSYRSAMDPDSGFFLSFVGFTCGVGLCEEICKAAPVFYYLRNTRKSDWRGACLLGFASGAGFGISEGIMYAGSFYNGIEPVTTYIVRFVSCVALHAVLSGGVSLLMFGNQDYLGGDCDWMTFLVGGMHYILIAMILHGLYDTLLKQNLNAVGLLVALVSFSWLAWLSTYYWDYEPSV